MLDPRVGASLFDLRRPPGAADDPSKLLTIVHGGSESSPIRGEGIGSEFTPIISQCLMLAVIGKCSVHTLNQ
jgi:hypothetical protein